MRDWQDMKSPDAAQESEFDNATLKFAAIVAWALFLSKHVSMANAAIHSYAAFSRMYVRMASVQ